MKIWTSAQKSSRVLFLVAVLTCTLTAAAFIDDMMYPSGARADTGYCWVGYYCATTAGACFGEAWTTCVNDACGSNVDCDLGADDFCWCSLYPNSAVCQEYAGYC